MHGLALIYVVRDLPGVTAFKIIQHDLKRTEVQIVADLAFQREFEGRIRRGMRARLGEDVDIVVGQVATIPPERSGKHRYVRNVARSASAALERSASSRAAR